METAENCRAGLAFVDKWSIGERRDVVRQGRGEGGLGGGRCCRLRRGRESREVVHGACGEPHRLDSRRECSAELALRNETISELVRYALVMRRLALRCSR